MTPCRYPYSRNPPSSFPKICCILLVKPNPLLLFIPKSTPEHPPKGFCVFPSLLLQCCTHFLGRLSPFGLRHWTFSLSYTLFGFHIVVVGGPRGGGGCCALYAPLFGPPNSVFRTHFCSLRLYAYIIYRVRVWVRRVCVFALVCAHFWVCVFWYFVKF